VIGANMPTKKPTTSRPRCRQVRETLLYRIAPHNGGLVFAPKDLALHVARIYRALEKARTWGQFRKMMPRSEYSSLIREFDENGEPRPKSTDPFDSDQIAGLSDGNYPQFLQQEMEYYLPDEVLNRYGTLETTMHNGFYWMIPRENARDMIRELEESGFRVESGSKLDLVKESDPAKPLPPIA